MATRLSQGRLPPPPWPCGPATALGRAVSPKSPNLGSAIALPGLTHQIYKQPRRPPTSRRTGPGPQTRAGKEYHSATKKRGLMHTATRVGLKGAAGSAKRGRGPRGRQGRPPRTPLSGAPPVWEPYLTAPTRTPRRECTLVVVLEKNTGKKTRIRLTSSCAEKGTERNVL